MSFNELHSSHPLTLETVKCQLDHWRATRVKGNKIPEHLWDALQKLTKHYSYRQIASELKINPHRLRAKIEKEQPHQQTSPLPKSNFIEVPLNPLPFPFAHPPSLEPGAFDPHGYAGGILEVTRQDGLSIKASGVNQSSLCTLLKSLLNV